MWSFFMNYEINLDKIENDYLKSQSLGQMFIYQIELYFAFWK